MIEQDKMRSAVVIGDESLLIQCVDTLQAQGIAVSAVVSDAPDIISWADDSGYSTYTNTGDLAASLSDIAFDYLFSITNLKIIADDVLEMADRQAINFHDGPLPAYAGLHATSWALLNRESSHGVTWHTMEAGVDTGDILKQVTFDIAEDETAYTLNVKCYENAIRSFEELVGELLTGTEVRTAQDLSLRSYFGKFKRPAAAATLDWGQPTVDVVATARALDFGPVTNPLGRAKILVGDQVFVVDGIDAGSDDQNRLSATIIGMDNAGVSVATADGAVVIASLIDADLSDRAANEVFTAAGLAVGDILPVLDDDRAERLGLLDEQAGRQEAALVAEVGALETIELPFQRLTHESEGAKPEAVSFDLPDDVLGYLVSDRAEGPSRPSTLVAAFACYLSRLTGLERFHLAHGASLPADQADLRPWFGPAIALRYEFAGDEAAADVLDRLAGDLEQLPVGSALSCDVGLRHPDLHGIGIGWFGLPLSIGADIGRGGELPASGNDLTFVVDEETGACSWVRNPSAYPADVFARIEAQFIGFLRQLAADDRRPLAEISLLSDEEYRKVVVDWNDNAKSVDLSTTLQQLFTTRAAERGDATALIFENATLTYAELDGRSNQLARHLQGLGVGTGSRVGIFMDRGLDMIVSLFGVLKAGAAYVPLDPGYPRDRIGFMISDADLGVILSSSQLAAEVPTPDGSTARVIAVDGEWPTIAARPDTAPETTSGPQDLAYLIYTSGSTGKPKGVMVTHANVVNFFEGMDEHITHEVGDTWLTVTSLSFDISVLEIFWSLTRGLELVVFMDRTTSEVGSGPTASAVTGPVPDRDIGFSLFYFASDESEADGGQKYQLLLDGARFADENGFDAVWTPERHFYAFGGLYPNPSVTSAAIAAITENVKIRAGSCVLPLHHPARVAEEWAVVDNISGGRVGIAFAAGWQPVDFVLRPENFEDRKGALIRDVDVVQRLWQGETIEMDGPNGAVDVRTLPRPVQADLPTWLTVAGNPDTFAAAGAGGHNVLTHLLGQSVEDVGEKIEIYRNARRAAGHEGDGHVTLMLHTYIGDDIDSVRDKVRPSMIEYLRSSVALIKEAAWSFPTFQQKAEASGGSPLDVFENQELTDEEMDALLEHAFSRYFDGSALFGTTESCLAMVDDLKRIGVDEIACQVDFGVPADEVLANLPLLDELRRRAKVVVVPEESPVEPPAPSVVAASDDGAAEQDFSIPALIQRHEVSHFQCTPSMGSMLVADDRFRQAAAGLKMCLMGGEAFPQTLAKEITDVVNGMVLNVYGPTETTIWSSVQQVENGDRPVSIGRPLANQQMYIVDRNLAPCPVGVPGELLIGGDGVTNGYLDRPELTDERFVPDRFRSDRSDGRLYRTGDLVRYEADGAIEFLGRMDFQVKIRGYRIELGEIEARLNEHRSVREAVVTAREDTPGDQRLVAYAIPQSSGDGIDGELLRAHLGEHLPEFMVPAHYVTLDRFPLTPNKKTDRMALPAPEAPAASSNVAYVAPQQGAQQDLVRIWQQMLGVSQVGVDDNFFDLGGHSLLAVQLNRQIKADLGIELSITDVFRFPTIASLTKHLDNGEQATGAANTRAAERAAARRNARAGRPKPDGSGGTQSGRSNSRSKRRARRRG